MTYSCRRNIFFLKKQIFKINNPIDTLKKRMNTVQEQISELEDCAEYFFAGYSAEI